MIKTLGRK